MIESAKISAERVHQLFQFLKKLKLHRNNYTHDAVEDVYNAWKYAEKYEL